MDEGLGIILGICAIALLCFAFFILSAIDKFLSVLAYQAKAFIYRTDGSEWILIIVVGVIACVAIAYFFYKMGVFDAINDILGG